MGNKIYKILVEIDTWSTRDIETLINLLNEYLETERSDN